MPTYDVFGADQSSGQDRAIAVNAANPQDAEDQASSLGIFVSRVQESVAAATSPLDVASDPLRFRKSSPVTPKYTGLQLAGTIIVVVGILTILLSLTLVAIHLATAGTPQTSELLGRRVTTGGVNFAVIGVHLMIGVGGIFQVGIGQAALALRDIAMNSWK